LTGTHELDSAYAMLSGGCTVVQDLLGAACESTVLYDALNVKSKKTPGDLLIGVPAR
jgi:hypothetical protein